jgi:hypothetical protein
MHRRAFLTLWLVVGIALSSRGAAPPPPSVKLDLKVYDLLASSAAFYAARKSFEADITSATNITMTGLKQEMDSSFHIAFLRPNSFAFVLQSGMLGGSLVCDGKTTVTYEPILHKYTSAKAPADLESLFQPMAFVLVGGGLPLGFEPFFRKNPLASFQENLQSSRDLGLEKLGDVPAHHVQLVSTIYTTDMWIADGAMPLLLQIHVSQDMSDSLKHLSADMKKKLPPGFSGMTMTRTTSFTNWKFDQPIAPDTFVFHPPADARLVADFAPPPTHPLAGKPTAAPHTP